jgi:hypothetical protein
MFSYEIFEFMQVLFSTGFGRRTGSEKLFVVIMDGLQAQHPSAESPVRRPRNGELPFVPAHHSSSILTAIYSIASDPKKDATPSSQADPFPFMKSTR